MSKQTALSRRAALSTCLEEQLDAAGTGALAAGGANHEAFVRLLNGVELVPPARVLVWMVSPR